MAIAIIARDVECHLQSEFRFHQAFKLAFTVTPGFRFPTSFLVSSMTIHKFAMISVGYKADPFPTWAAMREAGPVIKARIPLVGKVWMFTTYDAVSEMLRDDELFVRDPSKAGRKYVAGILRVMPKSVRALANNMLAYDGAEHRRLRRIVDKAFQYRRVDEMQPDITAISSSLMERISPQLEAGESVDLVENFARQLPLAVISELLGLPKADRDQFHDWGHRISTVKSMSGLLRMFPGLWKIRNYIAAQIEVCKQESRDGLLSALVHTEHEGEKLSDEELLAMGFLLLVAGHETTVHLISTAIATLLKHPQQLLRLQDNWELSGSMVDEVMRYVSPAEMTKPRMLSRDAVVNGQQLKRGDYAVGMLGAANHDPAKFQSPERFDIGREPNFHLGFGTGIHVCLGMKLAKTEAEIAVESLFQRHPDLALTSPNAELEWTQRIGFRSLNRLLVTK